MNAELLRESLLAFTTQIEDLQSELETSARCADRIHADVTVIDPRVMNHVRQVAQLTVLRRRADELKKSIRDQRTILRDLRKSVDQVRLAIHGERA